MSYLVPTLIGLSAFAFVSAVVNNWSSILPIPAGPEGLSRASSNLALLAIALILYGRANGQRA